MPVRQTFSTVEEPGFRTCRPTVRLALRSRGPSGRVRRRATAPIGEESHRSRLARRHRGSSEFIAETLVPLMAARRSPDLTK